MRAPLILIEFNELCPTLLDRWMAQGQLPNFSRFFQDSAAFISNSDEPAAPYLEPWIQWYSLHTGLPYQQHKVFHLTDGPRGGHLDIWEMLQEAGLRVGNFSSMNAKQLRGAGNFFLADPWCSFQEALPKDLNVFQRYVSANVLEYSRRQSTLGFGDHARFLRFLIEHGLSLPTVATLVRQIASELIEGRHLSWRRASLLDRLQLDVFMHYYRRTRPQFATFFVNSTAHYQHSYWRDMEPERFSVQSSKEQQQRHRDSILYGYQRMDDLLGDFFRLEAEGAQLILATALSQQPFLRGEAIGGQRFYRPLDVASMMREFAIPYSAMEPVMTHQFKLRFESAIKAKEAADKLDAFVVDGHKLFGLHYQGEDSLLFGVAIHEEVSNDAVVSHLGSNRTWLFGRLFYLIDATKSGCHHPEGALWFKFGSAGRRSQSVSILDVVPTLMNYFEIPVPSRWNGPGHSLLDAIEDTPAMADIHNAA